MLVDRSGVCQGRGAAIESAYRGNAKAPLCFRSFGRMLYQKNKKAEKQHIYCNECAFPLMHRAIVVDMDILVVVKLVDTHGNSRHKKDNQKCSDMSYGTNFHGAQQLTIVIFIFNVGTILIIQTSFFYIQHQNIHRAPARGQTLMATGDCRGQTVVPRQHRPRQQEYRRFRR